MQETCIGAVRLARSRFGMSDARSKLSSRTLIYRYLVGPLEVLLVHPAGNYNRRAPWGIPKGAPDLNEELEAAAARVSRAPVTETDTVAPLSIS